MQIRSFWIFVLLCAVCSTAQQPPAPVIRIDAQTRGTPFPHFWEKSFGSGRAILALRDAYRTDLRLVKHATDFQYVRFHGIFDDEVGVYDEDEKGNPVFNFTYVDQIYDGLLAAGVRPIVELSFMPKKLAASPVLHPFWYKPSPSPPRDWKRWEQLVSAFTRHLVERYGINEVARWYFEVWNEPNIDFWAGEPKQETYWQLYDASARAIKAVSTRLRVGGPSTAQAQWVPEFIRHAVEAHVPVDFVSTHVYGSDPREGVFGEARQLPQNDMVCISVEKVHDEIKHSARPDLPLFFTEYNYGGPEENTAWMAPWLAHTVHDCDGKVDILSYWVFADVFEEEGVPHTPFQITAGTVAQYDLPKSSFYAFEALHRLGEERLPTASDSLLVTRTRQGSIVIAAWNLPANPKQQQPPLEFAFELANSGARRARIYRVDSEHGNLYAKWKQVGSPAYPTPAQQRQLRATSAPGAPETIEIRAATFRITVPAPGLAIIELY